LRPILGDANCGPIQQLVDFTGGVSNLSNEERDLVVIRSRIVLAVEKPMHRVNVDANINRVRLEALGFEEATNPKVYGVRPCILLFLIELSHDEPWPVRTFDSALDQVTSRGNERKAIFKDDTDRKLDTLACVSLHEGQARVMSYLPITSAICFPS
jgi:hypothetical protein